MTAPAEPRREAGVPCARDPAHVPATITADAVRRVVAPGETIEAQPDDLPLPSRLVLGRIDGRPVHVVVAEDAGSAATVVVTVYEPDRALWQTDFRPRRKQ